MDHASSCETIKPFTTPTFPNDINSSTTTASLRIAKDTNTSRKPVRSPLRVELAKVLNVSASELQGPTVKGRQKCLRNALTAYLLTNHSNISKNKKVADRFATTTVNDCGKDLQQLLDL
jgi:hypothetical protein